MAVAGNKLPSKRRKPNFKNSIIDKTSAIMFDKFKCPECDNTIAITYNMDFLFCTYVKCNWFDAYVSQVIEQINVNNKFSKE